MRALLISLILTIAAQAGTITGTVRAVGKGGVETGGGGGKYESRKFKFAERVDYSALHEFVVYIEGPVGGKSEPPKKPLQIVVQKDAQFSPHLLPVVLGTTVEWPHHDGILR